MLQGLSKPEEAALAQLSARMQQLARREAALLPPPEAAPSFAAEHQPVPSVLDMRLAEAGQACEDGEDAAGLLIDPQLQQNDGGEGSSPLQALRLAMALPGCTQPLSSSREPAGESRGPKVAQLRATYQAMLQRLQQRHQQERAQLQHGLVSGGGVCRLDPIQQ